MESRAVQALVRSDVPIAVLPADAPRWQRVAVVRVVAAVLAAGGIAVIGSIPPALAAGLAPTSPGAALAGAVVGAVAALALYAGLVRAAERRPVTELSTPGAGSEALAGAVLGAGLFAVTIGIIALAGAYRVVGTGALPGVVGLLALSVYSGVIEEIVLRGLVLRVLEESLGTWFALAATAVLFGALHLGNPDATLWGAIAIALEAGVLLGGVFVLTRRLWMAMALHAAWNFTQGGVFGVEISGTDLGGAGLLRSQLSGPAWLSGGGFGAEASVVAVVVCLAASWVILRWAIAAGRIVAPVWQRPAARNDITGER